jgi:hypothetical protein
MEENNEEENDDHQQMGMEENNEEENDDHQQMGMEENNEEENNDEPRLGMEENNEEENNDEPRLGMEENNEEENNDEPRLEIEEVEQMNDDDEIALEAIRELSLMGPVKDTQKMKIIESNASLCVGSGCSNEFYFQDIISAIKELCYRSNFSEIFVDNVSIRMEQSRQRNGSRKGSIEALSKLRSERLQHPVVFFKDEIVKDASMLKDSELLSPSSFLDNVDTTKTDPYCLNLVVRFLWHEEKDVTREFFQATLGGGHNDEYFDIAWETQCSHFSVALYYGYLMSHLKHSILAHPFLRKVIPKLMKSSVIEYEKREEKLIFYLDDGNLPSKRLKYVLKYNTGEICELGGLGVICNLYRMQRYFTGYGGAILMSAVLADIGIREGLLYDSSIQKWRICDKKTNIWRFQATVFEPEDLVISFVEKELRPLQELELFRDVPFEWCVYPSFKNDEDEDDGESTNSVNTVASKRSKTGRGFGDNKRRTAISTTLTLYTQNVRAATEVLKTLQQRVLLDFSKLRQKHILCCPNGVVDLRTGELLGPPKPEQFITQMCATEYDPNIDVKPAVDFFMQFFPVEEYPDNEEVVQLLQHYIGYGLTLETNLQICLNIYGDGSNSKSVLMRALGDILGKMICTTIPIESLSKTRGTNNDSLAGAANNRLVLISESNGRAKINVATYNALVCGEETTTKV